MAGNTALAGPIGHQRTGSGGAHGWRRRAAALYTGPAEQRNDQADGEPIA